MNVKKTIAEVKPMKKVSQLKYELKSVEENIECLSEMLNCGDYRGEAKEKK